MSRLEDVKVHTLILALDGRGQLHASAALTPEKKSAVTTDYLGHKNNINITKKRNM
jgi:hypothetical protein